MKKILLSSVLLIGVIASANSKIELGGGIWTADPKGSIEYKNTKTDLKNDFALSEENFPYFYADIQHPIPILPNLRLEYTDINYSGSTNKTISFGNQIFNLGTVYSNIELQTLDGILYYNIFNKIGLNVDLGLDFKYINGEASAKNSVTSEQVDINTVIPHLYGNVRYDFSCGAGIELEGKYLGYDGAKSYDYSAKIDYKLVRGLGIELGYKEVGLDVPKSFADTYDLDTILNYNFSGLYAGANYRF